MTAAIGIPIRLLIREAGVLSAAAVAKQLGRTRPNVDQLLMRRRLLGVRFGSRWQFPSIQFRGHEILPGLATVLRSMGNIHPWAALAVLLSPLDEPSLRPIERLSRGNRAGALVAASRAAARLRRSWGEAGANPRVQASLDEDLEADLRRDREIDALRPDVRKT